MYLADIYCIHRKGELTHLLLPCNSFLAFLPLLSFVVCLNHRPSQSILLYYNGKVNHTFTVSSDQPFKSSDWQWQPGKKAELSTLTNCCLTCGCFAVLTTAQYAIWSTSSMSHVLWRRGGKCRGGRRKEESKTKAYFYVTHGQMGTASYFASSHLKLLRVCLLLIKYHPWFQEPLTFFVLITHIVDTAAAQGQILS